MSVAWDLVILVIPWSLPVDDLEQPPAVVPALLASILASLWRSVPAGRLSELGGTKFLFSQIVTWSM